MKTGDQIPVSVEGYTVALATVESVENDVVTFVVPATRVQMGLKSSLTDLEPEVAHDLIGTTQGETGSSDAIDEVNSPRSVDEVNESGSLKNMDLDSSAVDKDD